MNANRYTRLIRKSQCLRTATDSAERENPWTMAPSFRRLRSCCAAGPPPAALTRTSQYHAIHTGTLNTTA